jgi:hypothetical protein
MDWMTRTYLFIAAIALISCLPAHAQDCGTWLNTSSWEATFTLSGSGSGLDGDKAYTWTVKHSGSVEATLLPSALPCTWISWLVPNITGTGSMNDKGTQSCGTEPDSTYTIVGSGPLSRSASAQLIIDATDNSYTFQPDFAVQGTYDAQDRQLN